MAFHEDALIAFFIMDLDVPGPLAVDPDVGFGDKGLAGFLE
jgi:hypothetical protein